MVTHLIHNAATDFLMVSTGPVLVSLLRAPDYVWRERMRIVGYSSAERRESKVGFLLFLQRLACCFHLFFIQIFGDTFSSAADYVWRVVDVRGVK